jgi:UPF0755 protein
MAKTKKSRWISCLSYLFLFFVVLTVLGFLFMFRSIQTEVTGTFGDPENSLDLPKKFIYTYRLYVAGDQLLIDQNDLIENYFFEIIPGESIGQIAYRLKSSDLIVNEEVFKDFLIYKGYDRKVQSGYFRIEPEMNGIEIAEKITSLVPDKVRFNILPGWRAEEIAAVLPQSGVLVDPSEFLGLVNNPSNSNILDPYHTLGNLEGYLLPGEYLIDREISIDDFINTFLISFENNIQSDWSQALESKNLTIHEAVILASIVQREAVHIEEMPMIASVFINRHKIGMKLDSDPTVQYAIGYNVEQATWWTNPLSLEDLQFDSVFNTYLYSGLPPHPICNPSLSAIQAVAFAPETPYYYFRATCDGSGFHDFSETYEEHLGKSCP